VCVLLQLLPADDTTAAAADVDLSSSHQPTNRGSALCQQLVVSFADASVALPPPPSTASHTEW